VISARRAIVTLIVAYWLLTATARANMPPPQQFAEAAGKAGKAKAALVVQSDNSGGPSGVKQRAGSEYDIQSYCHVILDFLAQDGAKGQFTLRGSPTGYLDAGAQGPFIDEVAPISVPAAINLVDAYGSGWKQKTIVAPLRHNVTFFEWTPSSDSTGAPYVWATPIPCGLNTDGF
jgi:hypothetical protein